MSDIYEKEKLKFVSDITELFSKHMTETEKKVKIFYDVQDKVADKKCLPLISELIEDDIIELDSIELKSKANQSEISKFNEYLICKEKAVQNSLKLESHHTDDMVKLNKMALSIATECLNERRIENSDVNKLRECFEEGKQKFILHLEHISGIVKEMELETKKLKNLL
jgi:hypothetical protein